ncbi:MAG: OmpA family protein [Bacteroidia bacterium]|nr:OmpA family protein [Bacteroidia bacterium]
MKKTVLLTVASLAGLLHTSAQEGFSFDSTEYVVTPAPFNTSASEYGAYGFKDEVFFVTDRENRFGVSHYDEKTQQPFPDIYHCLRRDTGFSKPHPYDATVNSPFAEGPSCISSDGELFFFTATRRPKEIAGKRILGIYWCKKEGSGWSPPQLLPFIKDEFSYAYPSLSADGDQLYFSSDRAGGAGGMDIYVCEFLGNTWGKPENLGPLINSTFDEMFPFIESSGLLFYSTARKSKGGLDIFVAEKIYPFDEYEVERLGEPFNTPYDDFGFFIYPDHRSGYFSSNRTGQDDIYRFRSIRPRFEDCIPTKQVSYCFTFFEENSALEGDTTRLSYEWDFGNGIKVRGKEADHCFAQPGVYTVQLNIVEKESGLLFFTQASYEITVDPVTSLFIDVQDTLPAGKTILFDGAGCVIPNHSIKEYFWEFGSWRERRGMQVQYAFRKPGKYKVILGVRAVSDSSAASIYQCVFKDLVVVNEKDYLTIYRNKPFRQQSDNTGLKTGLNIDPNDDSISYRLNLGYSASQIPLTSKMFDGIKDVKEIYADGVYRYTAGETKKMIDLFPYFVKAKQKGFRDASVLAFRNDQLIPGQAGSQVQIFDSTVVKAYTVFFPNREFILLPGQTIVLDSLVRDLKKKSDLRIFISGHSDNMGDDYLNFRLSEKRAQVVRDYLVKKGVNYKRIAIRPFGSDVPIAPNDNEDGRKFNRRTDIIVHF